MRPQSPNLRRGPATTAIKLRSARALALALPLLASIALPGLARAQAGAIPGVWPAPPGAAQCQGQRDAAASAKVLSLADALTLAACRSPELARTLASIDWQRAGLALANAANHATVSAEASASRTRNSAGVGSAGEVVSDRADNLGLGLALRWVVVDFGQRAADQQRAGHELAAAEAERDAAALAVAAQVLHAYADATLADERATLRGQAHQVSRRNLEATRRLQAAGVNAALDVLRAEAVVAEQQLAWLRARGAARSARAALAVLLGLPGLDAASLAGSAQWLPAADGRFDVEAWVQRALSAHPRLRAGQARVQAARANSDAVRAQSRGTVSLAAGLGGSRVAESGNAGQVTNVSQRLGLLWSVPLWDGGGQDARSQQALARQRMEQASTDELALQIEQAVRREGQTWLVAREVMAAAETAVASAQAAEAAARQRHAAGVGPLSELLLAQQAVVDAQQARLASVADWADAQWRLLAVAGWDSGAAR